MNVLLISPRTPDTFWSFKHVLRFVSKKSTFPPLGLLTVAALLPREWQLKVVDLNVTRLTDADLRAMMMIAAGFRKVFVGIETPDANSLAECHKVQNQGRDLVEAVQTLQRDGLQVMGGFIVGFDSDQADIFKRQFEFIQRSGVVTAMVGLLNALPKTRLYQRLQREGPAGDEEFGQQHRRDAELSPETESRIFGIRLSRADEETVRAARILSAHPDFPEEPPGGGTASPALIVGGLLRVPEIILAAGHLVSRARCLLAVFLEHAVEAPGAIPRSHRTGDHRPSFPPRGQKSLALGSGEKLRGGKLLPLVPAGIPEIAELALLDGAVFQLHHELRGPAGFGFDHVFHHADGAGEAMHHDFAKITFASGRYFSFAHASQCAGNSGGFNVRMGQAKLVDGTDARSPQNQSAAC